VKNRRIFILPEEISDEIIFPPETEHYLKKVLRLKPGDQVRVFDGSREYLVRLSRSGGGRVKGVPIGSPLPDTTPPSAGEPEITIGFGCVRPRPFQEILRHCTELGVTGFVPLLSRRTNRRPVEKGQRWEKIVASAAAQSGRVRLPVVAPPMSFPNFISRKAASAAGLILSTDSGAQPLLEALGSERVKRVTLVVGPEGGFDPSEEALAVEGGFRAVKLGLGKLRTETAAIVAVGVTVCWHERFAGSSGPPVDRSET